MRRYRKSSSELNRNPTRGRHVKMGRASGSSPRSRSLRLERLEDRRLLAITVDTLVDELDGSIVDGDISLRDAIAVATSGATIDFSVTGTIDLTLGELVIDKDLVIEGPDAAQLRIDAGNGLDEVFGSQDGSRIFNIDDGDANTTIDVEIRGVTLAGADISGDGGAILSLENLTVANAIVTGNAAGNDGGGIYATGMSTITASTFSENSSGHQGAGIWANAMTTVADSTFSMNTSSHDGGGIFTKGETSVTNTTFSDNISTNFSGAGLFARTTILSVVDSSFTNNTSHRDGGGLFSLQTPTTISGTTFTGNTAETLAGGGVWTQEDTTITDSTFSGNSANDGGGLFASTSVAISGTSFLNNSASDDGGGILSFATMTITESTFFGNTASDDGGGIRGSGTTTITDSTIASNFAEGDGGGISASGLTTIINSTIYNNRAIENGGGVYLFSGDGTIAHSTITRNRAGNSSNNTGGGLFLRSGHMALDHSIVASNFDQARIGPDISGLLGAVLESRFSLVGSNLGSGLSESPVGSPDSNGNLIGGPIHGTIFVPLGLLADNGGPTQTVALLAGSPAIDAGDPNAMAGLGGVPMFDQRGMPFSRATDGNGLVDVRIDIGAFEAPTVSESADFDQDGDVDGGDFLAWQRGSGITAPNGEKANGDADDDLDVDATDLDFWEQQYSFFEPATVAALATSGLEQVEAPAPDLVPPSPSASDADVIEAAIAILFAEEWASSDPAEEAALAEDAVLVASFGPIATPSVSGRPHPETSSLEKPDASSMSSQDASGREDLHEEVGDDLLSKIFG